jgi:hypothetical protein
MSAEIVSQLYTRKTAIIKYKGNTNCSEQLFQIFPGSRIGTVTLVFVKKEENVGFKL